MKIKATPTRITTRNYFRRWRNIRKDCSKLTQKEQFDFSGGFLSIFPQILINHFTPFHRSFVLRADRAAHFGSLDSLLSNSGLSGAWVDGKDRPTAPRAVWSFPAEEKRREREREGEEKALAPETRLSKWSKPTQSAYFSTVRRYKYTRCFSVKCPRGVYFKDTPAGKRQKSSIIASLGKAKKLVWDKWISCL